MDGHEPTIDAREISALLGWIVLPSFYPRMGPSPCSGTLDVDRSKRRPQQESAAPPPASRTHSRFGGGGPCDCHRIGERCGWSRGAWGRNAGTTPCILWTRW